MIAHRVRDLLPSPETELAFLDYLVSTWVVGAADAPWSALLRECADEFRYLRLSIDEDPEDQNPLVRIEFGIQTESSRRAEGALVARWLLDTNRTGELVLIMINGEHSDVLRFTLQLATYLDLPPTIFEAVDQDSD